MSLDCIQIMFWGTVQVNGYFESSLMNKIRGEKERKHHAGVRLQYLDNHQKQGLEPHSDPEQDQYIPKTT